MKIKIKLQPRINKEPQSRIRELQPRKQDIEDAIQQGKQSGGSSAIIRQITEVSNMNKIKQTLKLIRENTDTTSIGLSVIEKSPDSNSLNKLPNEDADLINYQIQSYNAIKTGLSHLIYKIKS